MLKVWNREVFGNVFQNLKSTEDQVLIAQFNFYDNPTEDNRIQLETARSNLSTMYLQVETLWRQKSRVQWLKEGDNNTSFFNTTVVSNRKKSYISQLQNNQGDWIDDQAALRQMAVDFFQKAFSSEPHLVLPSLLESLTALMRLTIINYVLSLALKK